ncbi:uncharacterized protein PG998_004542 [Apiospora kogelbergensis]|uniref:uncharacterized protein n=1 Tax=Apiospora kogelbergensis TaxID=1337665 RepID=UPI0031301A8E
MTAVTTYRRMTPIHKIGQERGDERWNPRQQDPAQIHAHHVTPVPDTDMTQFPGIQIVNRVIIAIDALVELSTNRLTRECVMTIRAFNSDGPRRLVMQEKKPPKLFCSDDWNVRIHSGQIMITCVEIDI